MTTSNYDGQNYGALLFVFLAVGAAIGCGAALLWPSNSNADVVTKCVDGVAYLESGHSLTLKIQIDSDGAGKPIKCEK